MRYALGALLDLEDIKQENYNGSNLTARPDFIT